MKLRKQLLVVSLITLTLPWVGCQYIREMETTLRQGQADALLATANAVAARLGADGETRAQLQQLNPPPGSTPVFAYTETSPPIVDGYDAEWSARNLSLQAFHSERGDIALQLAAVAVPGQLPEPSLYLLARVHDRERRYFNPTLTSPQQADHLLLYLKSGAARTLMIYATGPGDFQAAWLKDGNLQREYRVSGVTSEWHHGYQVELRLPLAWAGDGLGLAVMDSSAAVPEPATPLVSTLGQHQRIPPLVRQSQPLSEELAVFLRRGVQLQLANRNSRPVGIAGQLETPESNLLENRHHFLNWFYQTALGDPQLPGLDSPGTSGLMETPEVHQALSGDVSRAGWYQQGSQRVARVAVPVIASASSEVIAVVVADQSADSLATLTSSAFYKLLFYSLVVTCAASFSLIVYASWLSFRIRRLSRAAAGAISESGKIADDFPVFSSGDEIGELSRNYALLLTRLREYTNYLRSLSSKLSHELRTPLAIVKSSLENLEHEPLGDKARTYAERAKEGTERLSGILNAMSAASRVEQAIGAAELESIPCDELLSNLKGAYEDVYQHASFRLNIRRGDGPLVLMGSGELLVQMFDKLVDNAADFCPAKGMIELGLYRHQDTLVFTVHNQGPPLPKHMLGQLFDSMVSVRDKSTPHDNGQHLGLGLYIVRLIVDFHRGEVQCYNMADNSGVIFEIRLPAA